MDSKVVYYIPTYRRMGFSKTGVPRQKTWHNLPPEIQRRAFLVCDEEEALEFKKQGDYQVLVCPVQGQLTRVRQWLLENTKADVMFLLDDDLQFYHRKSKASTAQRNASLEETGKGLRRLESMVCGGYVMVGLGDRPGNNRNEVPVDFFARPHEVFGFLVPAMRKLGLQFRPPVMSDFDMILQLLQRGYAVPSSTDFFCGQVYSGKGTGGSNAPGGCSVYRTEEMMRGVVSGLQREFGYSVVRAVTKNTLWGDITERLDAYVRWKQLWGAAAVKHGNHSDPLFQKLLAGILVVRKSLLGEGPAVHFVENRAGKISMCKFSASEWREHCRKIWSESIADKQVSWRYSYV